LTTFDQRFASLKRKHVHEIQYQHEYGRAEHSVSQYLVNGFAQVNTIAAVNMDCLLHRSGDESVTGIGQDYLGGISEYVFNVFAALLNLIKYPVPTDG